LATLSQSTPTHGDRFFPKPLLITCTMLSQYANFQRCTIACSRAMGQRCLTPINLTYRCPGTYYDQRGFLAYPGASTPHRFRSITLSVCLSPGNNTRLRRHRTSRGSTGLSAPQSVRPFLRSGSHDILNSTALDFNPSQVSIQRTSHLAHPLKRLR